MYFKKLIVVFIGLCFFKNVSSTPDLIEEASAVIYNLPDNRIAIIKLTDNFNLHSLAYGKNKKISMLPDEITSKILDVDIYSVEINYSLGVQNKNSWLSIDE
ncbi:MAG: hypothetical protein JKX98_00115, partial [Alcanivoracaceae bacterium]|nr:hypothetical protein [Alcanivoracaceae bacterium]